MLCADSNHNYPIFSLTALIFRYSKFNSIGLKLSNHLNQNSHIDMIALKVTKVVYFEQGKNLFSTPYTANYSFSTPLYMSFAVGIHYYHNYSITEKGYSHHWEWS